MFNTHQLNIVRNEKLNFIEITTEDTFINISVNKRILQNNDFHNTHIISVCIQNPTTSPHGHGDGHGHHQDGSQLLFWPPDHLPHSISAQQPM